MYTFAEMIRLLDENHTAICVSGELKDFELTIRNGEYDVEEPNGISYGIGNTVYDERYVDTLWIIVEN